MTQKCQLFSSISTKKKKKEKRKKEKRKKKMHEVSYKVKKQ